MGRILTTLAIVITTWAITGCLEPGSMVVDDQDGVVRPLAMYIYEDYEMNEEGGFFTVVIFERGDQEYDRLDIYVDDELLQGHHYSFLNNDEHDGGTCVSPLRYFQLEPGLRLVGAVLTNDHEIRGADSIWVEVED